VPLLGSALGGADSLYATVQMPPGVPVATVAIGAPGAKNAGILAVQILALADPSLREKLDDLKARLARGEKV
jgi:phosphoribosylaminoimidazole carboxylase PurE protein